MQCLFGLNLEWQGSLEFRDCKINMLPLSKYLLSFVIPFFKVSESKYLGYLFAKGFINHKLLFQSQTFNFSAARLPPIQAKQKMLGHSITFVVENHNQLKIAL